MKPQHESTTTLLILKLLLSIRHISFYTPWKFLPPISADNSLLRTEMIPKIIENQKGVSQMHMINTAASKSMD